MNDKNDRTVSAGDEILVGEVWHTIVRTETLRMSEGGEMVPREVAVLANGTSWTIATRETRERGGK